MGKAHLIMSRSGIESRGDSCGTPEHIVNAVRQSLGGSITLDPCSNDASQDVVRADHFWAIGDDCLTQDWSQHYSGSLYVNPPYSASALRSLMPRIIDEAPRFHGGAVVLVNAITDTAYGADLVDAADAVLFPKRIQFIGSGGSNPHRQMFAIWGIDTALSLKAALGDQCRSLMFQHDAAQRWISRIAPLCIDNVETLLSARNTLRRIDPTGHLVDELNFHIAEAERDQAK